MKSKTRVSKDITDALKETLIDYDGSVIMSELKTIISSGKSEVELLKNFLKHQEYTFTFASLNEFVSILHLLLDLLSLDEFYSVLPRFDEKKLEKDIRENLSEIDLELVQTHPYSFDALIFIVMKYTNEFTLITFLVAIEDLEDILSLSFYEVHNHISNNTLITIENALSLALKSKNQQLYNSAISVINSCGVYFEHLRRELKNLYQVNQFITLRLVGGRTNIYVKGQLFNQCKYLLLNIPKQSIEKYETIDSIDEAAEVLDRSMEGSGRSRVNISAETEFWGHCSNIQAWAENDYDTRILHRNLAFPLLKRLVEVGDPRAKQVFKDEIASRLESGHATVILYILANNYLKHFNKQEINVLIEEIDFNNLIDQTSRSKIQVLRQFATLGAKKAQTALREEVRSQLRSADVSNINRLIQSNDLKYLTQNEVKNLFEEAQNNIIKSSDFHTKLRVLNHFAKLKIETAIVKLKEEVTKVFTKKDMNIVSLLLREGYLTRFNKIERAEIFEKMDFATTREDSTLYVLQKFSSLGIQEAKIKLKVEVKKQFQTRDIYGVRRLLSKNYLKLLDQEEINTVFETIDHSKLFSQGFSLAATLLEKFYKAGFEKARDIIKQHAREMVKHVDETNIRAMGTKSFLKYVTEAEIREIVNQNKQIIPDLLSIITTTRRYQVRNKALSFLQNIKVEELQQQISEILINCDFDSFHMLLKSKVVTLLDAAHVEKLLDEPKCSLREFIVLYNKKKYQVDHYLKLDLAEQNIRSLKSVRGLKNLAHLRTLDIRGNMITNIAGIGNLKNLKKLRIKGNPLPEALIKYLGGVDHYGNARDPRKFVEYSHRVETGQIERVKVKNKNYEIFDNILVLKNLKIKSLAEINGLYSLKNLRELDLSSNQITDLKGIEKLASLKKLKLQHNQIIDTTGIEKLTNLEELRLYGNNIFDLDGLQSLSELKIVDLDTKRKVKDDVYLNYLLLSLNKDDLKQICRDYYIRGYSNLKRDRLIEYLKKSLLEEERHEVIKKIEYQIIKKEIGTAFRKIKFLENEKIFNVSVKDKTSNKIELEFRGFNWEIYSQVDINATNIDDPFRRCDCRIGKNKGFCNHFWIGVIYSLKEKYFKVADWTLTTLPSDFEQNLSQVKVISGKKGEKQLVSSSFKKKKLPDLASKKTPDNVIKQWAISSYTNPHNQYTVTLYKDMSWACSCPHWVYRRATCKHIRECQSNYYS